MPITKITTSGTFQLKSMAGYITSISVPAAGTSWTLQIFDGPNPAGNSNPVYGGTTAGTIVTSLAVFQPLYCSTGIQVVTAGASPGEIDIQWY